MDKFFTWGVNGMKRLLIHLKRLFYTIIYGIPLTVWLLWRDRKTVYVVPYIGLGEYCIGLGYLDVLKKIREYKHITLLVPSNRAEVARFYPYWDSLLVLKEHYYLGIACFGSIPIGRSVSRRIKRIVGFYFSQYIRKSLLCNNPGTHVDAVLKMVWKIPRESIRKAPQVPDVDLDTIVKKYGLIYQKTVLFNPYTSGDAVQEIPGQVYNELVHTLRQNGFTVATITNGHRGPLPDTQGIPTSLAEAWHLVRWCGYVIGTRSGFFDFIRLSGCHMFCIYDPWYEKRDVYSLLPPDGEGDVREYVWRPGHEKRLVDDIVADVTGK